MKRRSIETEISTGIGSVMNFKLLSSCRVHRIWAIDGTVVFAQGLLGTGLFYRTFEFNRDFLA